MRLREIISDPAECPSSSRIETVVALWLEKRKIHSAWFSNSFKEEYTHHQTWGVLCVSHVNAIKKFPLWLVASWMKSRRVLKSLLREKERVTEDEGGIKVAPKAPDADVD